MTTALILGIGGQDGSFLAELLLEKGYEVHGLVRRSSLDNTTRITHLLPDIGIHEGDLLDPVALYGTIDFVKPDEIYNEADQDNVPWSYTTPGYSSDVTASAVAKLLEIIWTIGGKDIKFFQPLSATMFGNAEPPQNEETPFSPRSPYAVAKCAAYYWVQYYREVKGMFACSAIMYNHDSPRRSEEYLLQKICKSISRIVNSKQEYLTLGNLEQVVDIGYAPEFMEAAWEIMQLPKPDNFVLASNHPYSIREYVELAYMKIPTSLLFYSKYGVRAEDFVSDNVRVDPHFHRSDSPSALIGDISKAQDAFDFDPRYHGSKLIGELIA